MLNKNNGMITRHSLKQLFDTRMEARMLYVCAPAGYGKTVAVQQWLADATHSTAYVSFDIYDNNPARFCERFCAALRVCRPHNTALKEIVSHPAFYSAPDEFTFRALSVLSGSKRATLALDDLHLIHEKNTLAFLLACLKRLPDSFQIILISRSGLPEGFSDLWLSGQLARITADELRFSNTDIAALYKKRGLPVSAAQIADIARMTKGWAIGINALLLSGGRPSAETLDYFDGFLRANVWERWSEKIRAFMLKTASAQAMYPELCAHLTGVANGEKWLKYLLHSGAFVYQSGDGAYHYHPIFHGFLRGLLKERGDGFVFPLLEKEGEWHLSRQDFYSAADCFIRCKNHAGIAKCFDILEIADRNEFIIERMLPIVKNPETEAAAATYPVLFYLMAWGAYADGRVADMTTYMDQYYSRYPEVAARDPAHAHNIFYMRIFDFRVPLSQLVAEMSSVQCRPAIKGVQGSATMNMPLLHRSIYDFSELAAGDIKTNIAQLSAAISWLFGAEWTMLIESLTAGLLYEQGHLERAYAHALTANAEAQERFVSETQFCILSIRVCALDAMGQTADADRVIENAAAMIERHRAYYLNRNYRALVMRRQLQKGDKKAAQAYIATCGAALADTVSLYGIYETFTLCRAYILCADYSAAILLLQRILKLANVLNRPLDGIEAQMLLAVAYWQKKRGFQEEALQYMAQAVSTAETYGYTQIFVNDGALVSGMLHRLGKRWEQQDKPRAAFARALYGKTAIRLADTLADAQTALQGAKFTEKQKAVMRLQCEGKSYKEMANALGIKVSTLRSHIALIYKKLDVTCEADAVRKMQAAGLLDDA